MMRRRELLAAGSSGGPLSFCYWWAHALHADLLPESCIKSGARTLLSMALLHRQVRAEGARKELQSVLVVS